VADWDAGQYLKFEDERTRAAVDLLRRVPLEAVEACVDIGCGPGNSTSLLAARFPGARVSGLDSSEAMLRKARERLPAVSFQRIDLQEWRPDERWDLIFGNAVLQWLPDHPVLLPRLISYLKPGGCLAVQMPDNLDEPSHVLMEKIARSGPWRGTFASAFAARAPLASLEAYYAWLQQAGCSVDIWRTTYVHALDGAGAIVEWFKATGLKPYLDPLPDDERAAFLERYVDELVLAYPEQPDGKVLLRFPRLFFVAQRR
jgi:trans-aconitate 2-methyltransferase